MHLIANVAGKQGLIIENGNVRGIPLQVYKYTAGLSFILYSQSSPQHRTNLPWKTTTTEPGTGEFLSLNRIKQLS